MNESANELPIRIDAEFEDQLRRTQIPDAKLDCAQLMYDAGWAAAMASLGGSSTAPFAIPEQQVDLPARNSSASPVWRWATVVSIAAAILFAGLYFSQLTTRVPSAEQLVKQVPVEVRSDQPPKTEVVQEPVRVSNFEGISLEKVLENWPDGVPLNAQTLRGGSIPNVPFPLRNRFEGSSKTEATQEVLRSGPSMRLLKKLGLLGSGM